MGLLVATLEVDGQPIYGSDNYLTVCWIKQFNLGALNVNPAMWGLFYVPLVLIFIVAIACIISVRRRIMAGVPTTARTRLHAFRSTLRFVALAWRPRGALAVSFVRGRNGCALRVCGQQLRRRPVSVLDTGSGRVVRLAARPPEPNAPCRPWHHRRLPRRGRAPCVAMDQ